MESLGLNFDRRVALEASFILIYQNLKEIAFEQYPGLSPFDVEPVLALVAEAIYAYEGDTSYEAVEAWAEQETRRQAHRFKCTEEIMRTQGRVIRAAVSREMRTVPLDAWADGEDVEAEVYKLIADRAASLASKGTAKQSTRIYALVKQHIRFYYRRKRLDRLASVKKCVDNGWWLGVESITPLQMAAEKASERNAIAA